MEEWKDVKGYEGMYEVSSLGRVRSLDRIDCAGRKLKGVILKQAKTRGQYLMVGLSKDGLIKYYRVNRLVAIAFILNSNHMPQAGHQDDNKQNNKAYNLYWTDSKENNTHNGKQLRMVDKMSKKIIGVHDSNNIIFKSATEAGRNGFNQSAIRNCLAGLSKTHKGYTWDYA